MAGREVKLFEDGEREVGTTFDQKQFVYRGVFEQAQRGQLTGRFGFPGTLLPEINDGPVDFGGGLHLHHVATSRNDLGFSVCR